ncbi:MAG: hypothetical protein WDZ41_03870 [Candidatus Babeliales bacterium]
MRVIALIFCVFIQFQLLSMEQLSLDANKFHVQSMTSGQLVRKFQKFVEFRRSFQDCFEVRLIQTLINCIDQGFVMNNKGEISFFKEKLNNSMQNLIPLEKYQDSDKINIEKAHECAEKLFFCLGDERSFILAQRAFYNFSCIENHPLQNLIYKYALDILQKAVEEKPHCKSMLEDLRINLKKTSEEFERDERRKKELQEMFDIGRPPKMKRSKKISTWRNYGIACLFGVIFTVFSQSMYHFLMHRYVKA